MEFGETIRSPEEVACRVLALLGVIGLAHQRAQVTPWIVKNQIDQYFSANEAAFYADSDPERDQIIQFSWRAEAIVPMIWALQGVAKMPSLTEQFDIFSIDLIRNALRDPTAFIDSAVLREDDELVGMEEYLYHQHWRVRDRDFGFNTDRPEPDDPQIDLLNTGIVTERRYGMSWISGDGEPWDDVSLDT